MFSALSTSTVLSVAAVALLGLLFVAFLVAIAVTVGIYIWRQSPKALSGMRWRCVKRSLDSAVARKQVDEDLKTLVEAGGYETK